MNRKLAMAMAASQIAMLGVASGPSYDIHTGTAAAAGTSSVSAEASNANRPRVFVTTDWGSGDKDDQHSLVHLSLYLDVINFRGLSQTRPDGAGLATEIQSFWTTHYAPDQAILSATYPNYPTAASLSAKTFQGKTNALGAGAPADGNDTAGSRALVAEALAASPTDPLWVLVWGTYGDLAQALFDNPEILPNIRVYGIDLQATGWNHDTDAGAADWLIANLVPGQPLDDLWIIANETTFRGCYIDSSGNNVPRRDFPVLNAWGHGHLGDYLGDVCLDNYGTGFTGNESGWKAGDTPSFLYILDNVIVKGTGEDPAAAGGGWGGRFAKNAAKGNNFWEDISSGQTLGAYPGSKTVQDHQATFLADFAARLDRIASPTVYTSETLSNLAATDTTIAGRVAVPSGHTWQNYRTDRPANAVNNANFDYITSAGTTGSVHYLDHEMPDEDYTTEIAFAFSATSASVGLLMNLLGTAAGGDGQFYSLYLISTTEWGMAKDFASSGQVLSGNTATLASTLSVSTNTWARMKLQRVGNVFTAWVRRTHAPGVAGNNQWVQVLQWTDTGTPLVGAGKVGVRGTNASRVPIIIARSNS